MKITKQQLRRLIINEIVLLKESTFPPVADSGISLPWRGDEPYNFSLHKKGKNTVHVYKDGSDEPVFYFYSSEKFNLNGKPAVYKDCGKKDYKEMFGDQCYTFRVSIPGAGGNLTFEISTAKQNFSILAIGG
jgi:hypothetical protein